MQIRKPNHWVKNLILKIPPNDNSRSDNQQTRFGKGRIIKVKLKYLNDDKKESLLDKIHYSSTNFTSHTFFWFEKMIFLRSNGIFAFGNLFTFLRQKVSRKRLSDEKWDLDVDVWLSAAPTNERKNLAQHTMLRSVVYLPVGVKSRARERENVINLLDTNFLFWSFSCRLDQLCNFLCT